MYTVQDAFLRTNLKAKTTTTPYTEGNMDSHAPGRATRWCKVPETILGIQTVRTLEVESKSLKTNSFTTPTKSA